MVINVIKVKIHFCRRARLIVTLAITISMIWNCSESRREIYQLEKFTKINNSRSTKVEYFVIDDPPRDEKELLEYVEQYVKLNLDSSDFLNYKFYSMVFFRETDRINESYKEDRSGYTTEYIDDNINSILIEISFYQTDSANYQIFYSFWMNGVPKDGIQIDLN